MLTANSTWNLANFRGGLIAALRADGHEVVVAAPSDGAVARLEAAGVRHVPVEIDTTGLSPVRDAGLGLRMRRLLQRERPDAVLSFTIKNNVFGGIAAQSLGIPFLPNVSGLGTAFLGQSWLAAVAVLLYKAAFRRLPSVLFQNPEDSALFVSKGIVTDGQVVLLPGSGIDLERFVPAPLPRRDDGGLTFLLIARLLRDKGVIEYVDAARALRQSHPGCRFQLLGEAGAANRTAIDRATVDGWVSDGVVEYLGTTDDVRPAIAAADCVVLPSYREGLPRTLLEAAAMARPLVATDVPGCRQLVRPGENGILCRVADAGALAGAMAAMIDAGHEARVAMGRAGRRIVEDEYDERIVIATYRRLIAEALDPGTAGHGAA